MAPSPSGGGLGRGPAAPKKTLRYWAGRLAVRSRLAPIPAFPQRGKKQNQQPSAQLQACVNVIKIIATTARI